MAIQAITNLILEVQYGMRFKILVCYACREAHFQRFSKCTILLASDFFSN